jgi:hypothetical protein
MRGALGRRGAVGVGDFDVSKSRETFLLRVEKCALVPNDQHTQERLRAKGYHFGDVLTATLRKPRNPAFHGLAHAFGQIVADNIESFSGMPAHTVLKRLQYEGDISCEHMQMLVHPYGLIDVRLPKSLSFDSMDEGEFYETFRAMCNHVSKTYWPDCSPEQIEEMASAMVEAA